MKRREFIAGLGGTAAWPMVVRGQQSAVPVIGFLSSASVAVTTLPAFRQGLKDTGYVEGQNIAIEYRAAEGQYNRLPSLAAELADRPVALIAAIGNANSAEAAKTATATIPIVFANGGDPVKLGLVATLSHPGGNVTGITFLNSDLAAKRLELLRELAPDVNLIALLTNPTNPNFESDTKNIEAAARTIGKQLLVLKVSTESEIESAFPTLAKEHAGALLTGTDAFIASRRDQIIALAAKQLIPAIYNIREFPEGGGLMSYGSSITDALRQAGIYAGKILKGAIIVAQEATQEKPLLPSEFMRRLIGFYGDTLRTVLACYLDFSLLSITNEKVRQSMTEAGSSALKLVDEQVQQNIKFIEAMLLNFNSSRSSANPSDPTENGKAKHDRGER